MISGDGLYSANIRSGGQILKEYVYEEKTLIIGPQGQEFEVDVMNFSQKRTLAVINVDGLCIVDGKELLVPGFGYILESHMPLTIKSWRFYETYCPLLRFRQLPEGMENVMDQPPQSGTIEVLFFEEQENPFYGSNWFEQMAFSLSRDSGVGWGNRPTEKFIKEQFARERPERAAFKIRYENHETLVKLGVIKSESS